MADGGVFAITRAVFDHPLFARERFTEREAWIWLVGSAAWRPMRVRAGKATVVLERGQCAFSERFLAARWRWSKSKVHRFILRLKTEAMVSLSSDHETNLITICNYDEYQFRRTTEETKTGPDTEPLADQKRTKEEEDNKGRIEEGIKKEQSALCAPAAAPREKVSRGTILPDDWQPSDADLKFAADHGLALYAIDIEATKFRNYWTAKAGAAARKRDWPRTWQNWILNVKPNGGQRERAYQDRTDPGAGPQPAGNAVIAGVGRAFANRFAQRRPEDRDGISGGGDGAAAGAGADRAAAAGDRGPPAQLELVARGDAGGR